MLSLGRLGTAGGRAAGCLRRLSGGDLAACRTSGFAEAITGRARPLCGALPGSSVRWAKTGKRAGRRHGVPGAGRRLAGKRERREKHASRPSHAGLRSLDRLRPQAGAAKARPVPAFPGPRSKNRRNPMAPLTIPSAGSTVCFRKRQRDRPSSVAILARMRSGQSAFGALAGLSAGGGRKPRARRRPSDPAAARASRPRFPGSATSVPAAHPLPASARSGEPSTSGIESTSAPVARAGARATPEKRLQRPLQEIDAQVRRAASLSTDVRLGILKRYPLYGSLRLLQSRFHPRR